MSTIRYRASIETVGSAGVAVGSHTFSGVHGIFRKAVVNYNASAPGTTVVAFTEQTGGVTETFLTLTGNTDAVERPSVLLADAVGADSAIREQPYIEGDLIIDVTLSDALASAVDIVVIVEE